MTHNDTLRRIRFAFDFNDKTMMAIFTEGGLAATRAQISDWLKKDDQESFVKIRDVEMAAFLNGLIIKKRGKKDGVQPKNETRLNNNIVFRKLRIALNLKDVDIIEILDLAEFRMSTHELSAFFRKPEHKNYRDCQDQILRNFLHGVQLQYKKAD